MATSRPRWFRTLPATQPIRSRQLRGRRFASRAHCMSVQRNAGALVSFITALGSFGVDVLPPNSDGQHSRNATGCSASSLMRPSVLAMDGLHVPNMSPSTLTWPQLQVLSITSRIALFMLKTCWWTWLAPTSGGTTRAVGCSRAMTGTPTILPDG